MNFPSANGTRKGPVEGGVPVTYRRKEDKTLHKEMRGEYDQEIHRRILDDLIQNRRDLGPSQASRFTADPNDDQERQEVCKC